MAWFLRRSRRTAVAGSPGRRTDAAGDYLFGESEAEIGRLNFQHYMFRLAFGGEFSSPIRQPQEVLDIASGTGRWARDMARQFRNANVIGFDISRDLLEASLAEEVEPMPENCTFVYGNALQPLAFSDGAFGLVMARACSSFIPAMQWSQVVGEMARVSRPGGWIEVRDFGLVRSTNAALNALTVQFASLAQARGIHPGSGPFLQSYFAAEPLRDVQVKHVYLRSGVKRGTRAGQLMLADYLALLERVTPVIAQAGLASAQQWQGLIAQAREETRNYPDQQYAEVELTAAYGHR